MVRLKTWLVTEEGPKAINKALIDGFGDTVLVKRCWLHKLRNLQKYIPEKLHQQLWWRIKRLKNVTSHDEAKKNLTSLIKWLSEFSIEAEKSG